MITHHNHNPNHNDLLLNISHISCTSLAAGGETGWREMFLSPGSLRSGWSPINVAKNSTFCHFLRLSNYKAELRCWWMQSLRQYEHTKSLSVGSATQETWVWFLTLSDPRLCLGSHYCDKKRKEKKNTSWVTSWCSKEDRLNKNIVFIF